MNLHTISIIPIEFFSAKLLQRCMKRLQNTRFCTRVQTAPLLATLLNELGGPGYDLYELTDTDTPFKIQIVFHNTSLCFVVERVQQNFQLSYDTARDILIKKNLWHEAIINSDPDCPVTGIVQTIFKALGKHTFAPPSINYVFTYHVIACRDHLSCVDERLLKLLAAPSLVDIDDMLSTHYQPETNQQQCIGTVLGSRSHSGKRTFHRIPNVINTRQQAVLRDDGNIFHQP